MPSETRQHEIDFMKALGVLAVILIHSKIGFIQFAEQWEVWMLEVTRFAVPAFLFASGYLYAGRPADGATTGRRLRRLLVPYLVLSLAVIGLRTALIGPPITPAELVVALLIGDATTFYYYVFVIVSLVVVTPLFQKCPDWLLLGACALFAATRLFHELDIQPIHPLYGFRSPTTWWSFFLLGWLVYRFRERLEPWARKHAVALLLVLVALWIPLSLATLTPQPNPRERNGISCRGLPCPPTERPSARLIIAFGQEHVACACEPVAMDGPTDATRVARWALPYFTLVLLWIFGLRFAEALPGQRFLSDASYSYYLAHVIPILLLGEYYRVHEMAPPYLVTWALAFVATTIVIVTVRGLLPRWSRDLIGY